MQLVEKIERRLMPQFEAIRLGLASEFPEMEHYVYSNSGGDLTPHPWHVMGVNSLLHTDWDNPPNEVMIQVVAYSLKTEPKLQAYVMWGNSIMKSVYDVFSQPELASDDVVAKIESSLPDLLEALKEEIRRGRPKAPLQRAET